MLWVIAHDVDHRLRVVSHSIAAVVVELVLLVGLKRLRLPDVARLPSADGFQNLHFDQY